MSRVFHGVAAVAAVDLWVTTGRVILLWGPNGAGKSTLLRLIGTAISPTFGNGHVLGLDLTRERAAIRSRTEMLGHRTRLYDELTPREYLRFVAGLYGLDATAIPQALERAEVPADRRIDGFSQGMRQRVALARAYLRSPALLLLDEPYAGLDDDARRGVDDLVGATAAAGGTVIVATHDTERMWPLADRAVRLERGRIADDGMLA